MKLTKPYISYREILAAGRVLRSGNLTQGLVSAQFEEKISSFVQSKWAFVTSSATTGLHLGLDVMGIGVGDEVIIPDFSFPATANSVIKVGASPVCVDIDLRTFCIDPKEIAKSITPKTKAIMPVHAFGLCANMPEILGIAKAHGLRVIEDAACAIGSTIGSEHAGTFGDCGVFSFHPRKLITTGEGGAVVTNDEGLSEKIKIVRSHGGIRRELYFEFVEAGFNFRLSDINSAIGFEQMAKIDQIIRLRRKFAGVYRELLGDSELLTTPFAPIGFGHTYQSYVVLLADGIDRDEVIRRMKLVGIETTIGTYSISTQPYFEKFVGFPRPVVPRSIIASRRSLTLPLYPGMRKKDVKTVATSLVSILEDLNRGEKAHSVFPLKG